MTLLVVSLPFLVIRLPFLLSCCALMSDHLYVAVYQVSDWIWLNWWPPLWEFFSPVNGISPTLVTIWLHLSITIWPVLMASLPSSFRKSVICNCIFPVTILTFPLVNWPWWMVAFVRAILYCLWIDSASSTRHFPNCRADSPFNCSADNGSLWPVDWALVSSFCHISDALLLVPCDLSSPRLWRILPRQWCFLPHQWCLLGSVLCLPLMHCLPTICLVSDGFLQVGSAIWLSILFSLWCCLACLSFTLPSWWGFSPSWWPTILVTSFTTEVIHSTTLVSCSQLQSALHCCLLTYHLWLRFSPSYWCIVTCSQLQIAHLPAWIPLYRATSLSRKPRSLSRKSHPRQLIYHLLECHLFKGDCHCSDPISPALQSLMMQSLE